MKKGRLRLNSMVSFILVISGLFQTALLNVHINMITRLFSSIIGFYFFAFIMFTILNILNGGGFKGKKTIISVVAVYGITAIQILFGVLYIRVALNEVALFEQITMTTNMMQSFVILSISMVASLLACVVGTIYYFKGSEMDMYLG